MGDTGGNITLPGVKHKVIGLVSGGKDSCFNLMHAVANGHGIVAIATLTPEQGIGERRGAVVSQQDGELTPDELDSHMYQSVGTELPPLIAQAIGLPHYSGIIRGKPVEQGMVYGSRERGGEGSGKEGDETEDLTALLRNVMVRHPPCVLTPGCAPRSDCGVVRRHPVQLPAPADRARVPAPRADLAIVPVAERAVAARHTHDQLGPRRNPRQGRRNRVEGGARRQVACADAPPPHPPGKICCAHPI